MLGKIEETTDDNLSKGDVMLCANNLSIDCYKVLLTFLCRALFASLFSSGSFRLAFVLGLVDSEAASCQLLA